MNDLHTNCNKNKSHHPCFCWDPTQIIIVTLDCDNCIFKIEKLHYKIFPQITFKMILKMTLLIK